MVSITVIMGRPEGPGWGSSWRRSVYVVGKSPHYFDET